MPKGRVYPSLEVRFWQKAQKPNTADANDLCWVWAGAKTRAGYGQIGRAKSEGGRVDYAHRISYEMFYDVDLGAARKDGPLVLHKCDNPSCVNPHHLFLGDDADNWADMRKKNRWRHGNQAGSANPRSRLTEQQVLSIRQETGTCMEIAEKYGLSISWVWTIRNRKSWTHV